MTIIFALFPKNLQQLQHFSLTSILAGKRTTQKCKKCDWSVKREFSYKNSENTKKVTISIFTFGKKNSFEYVIINW